MRSHGLISSLVVLLTALGLMACASTSPRAPASRSTVRSAPVSSAPTAAQTNRPRPKPQQAKRPRPAPARSCPEHASEVTRVAHEFRIDPHLMAAIITLESRWNPRAKNRSGAHGLMQIMPDTAKRLKCRRTQSVRGNLNCGATLLRRLLDRYDGHQEYALAAYAQGPRGADQAFAKRAPAPRRSFIDRVAKEQRAWAQTRCFR